MTRVLWIYFSFLLLVFTPAEARSQASPAPNPPQILEPVYFAGVTNHVDEIWGEMLVKVAVEYTLFNEGNVSELWSQEIHFLRPDMLNQTLESHFQDGKLSLTVVCALVESNPEAKGCFPLQAIGNPEEETEEEKQTVQQFKALAEQLVSETYEKAQPIFRKRFEDHRQQNPVIKLPSGGHTTVTPSLFSFLIK